MIVIVEDTLLFLIGLGKLPMSFQRQFRKNHGSLLLLVSQSSEYYWLLTVEG